MENNNIQTENMEFDPVCPNCGKESRGTSLFCTKCGAKLNVKEKEWICTACGKDNVAENKKFCGYCGAPKIEKDTTSSITTNSIDNIPTPSSDTSFTSPMPPTGQTDFAVPDIPEITENNPVKAKPKRNKKYAIIIAGISIVVILLTVLIPTALVPFLTEDKDDNIDIAEAYKNGETIVFGEYQWRILDLQSDKALIITENIVREQSFMQNINGEITWEGSAIRDYLNGSFYQSFTSEEQDKILAVQNHTECEPDTTDHIFLLSIDEADLYFENDSERAIGRIWWLRTPAVYDGLGSLSDEDPPIMGHATVTASGAIEDEGGFYMDSTGMLVDGNLASYGVRPALWLKLVESDGSPDVAPGNSQNSSDSSLTASVSVQGKWYQPSSDLEEKYYPEVTFNADNTFHFVVNLYHTMSYVDGTYVINGETVNCQVTSRGFPANSTWGTVESFRFVISTNGLTYDGEQIGTTYQNSIFQRDNRPSAPSTALTSRPEDTSTLVNQTSPTTTSKTPQPTTSITHAPQTTTSEEKPITIGQAIEFGNPRWDGSRRCPFYTQDTFLEVSDEVAQAMAEAERSERNYKRRTVYNKAQYSLDAGDGIEASAVKCHSLSPEVVLDLMDQRCRLCRALNSLSEIQGRRIDAHYLLGQSQKEIAKAEGVSENAVSKSIQKGLEAMRKILKELRTTG